MSKKIFFKNAKVVTHEMVFDGSVFVENGKISEVKEGDLKVDDAEVVDLEGKYLLPGLIDVHVHFRTPGHEYKEDWETGSKAALAGGVTTVLDMPNNDPSIIDEKSLRKKRGMVSQSSLVNYGFYIGATAKNTDEIKKMRDVAGVKLFMGSSTGDLLLDGKEEIEQVLSNVDNLIAVHAESEKCIEENLEKYKAQIEGNAKNLHLLIRAPECAEMAVKEILHLAKKYDARVHILHVSTEAELNVIRKFKNEKVTCEVTPNHLFLTENDYERFGTLIKVNPPIRNPIDSVALWEGIKDGTVDMIATDHAPHTIEEKKRPYPEAQSGIPGVQTMLPLLLNTVNEDKLSMEKVVELTSYNPAQKFNIKNKGEIKEGMDADLTVVDMDLAIKVNAKYLWSKCGWSPYENWELKGWPVKTYIGGELMYWWRDNFGGKLGKEVEYNR